MKRLTLGKIKDRERIIEEFKFTARFEPLTLQQAKVICDALEEYLAKYPFLRKKSCSRGLHERISCLRKRLCDQDYCCPRSWDSRCSRFRRRGEFKASGVRGRNKE